jgi:heme exporter protein D
MPAFLRKIALFRRWPQLRGSYGEQPVIPPGRAGDYPALAGDLATVAEVIEPAFAEHDLDALRAQNSFWRQQVLLIVVTAATTAFGAVQAAYSRQVWPGVVVAVLGVLSAAVAGLGEERSAQRTYLDQRTRAERLRALAFAYLAELPPFTGADREARLIGAVADIREGREPA